MVFDVYCSVRTVLFIYKSTAATFDCFRRCCHFFSPKDIFLKPNKWNNAMSTRVTKYRRAGMKRAKESRGRVVGQKRKCNGGQLRKRELTHTEMLCSHVTSVSRSTVSTSTPHHTTVQRSVDTLGGNIRPSVQRLSVTSICPQVACELDTKGDRDSAKTREHCCCCYDYGLWRYKWLLSAICEYISS